MRRFFNDLKGGDEVPPKELLTEQKQTYLSKGESAWLHEQAYRECTSESSLIRKALKLYRESVTKAN